VTEWKRDGYVVSDDAARLDVDLIHRFLAEESYWAEGRPREMVERSLANSINLGLYEGDRQLGFARVITDRATFAWVCDVFVLREGRGRGLGTWLMECVVQHPELKSLRRILLATRDAHDIYRRVGFGELPNPSRSMIRDGALPPG
jgi:GNAT superfamily N-acetyltransferase